MASSQPRYEMVRFDSTPENDLRNSIARDLSFDMDTSASRALNPSNPLGITLSPAPPSSHHEIDDNEQYAETISRISSVPTPGSSTAHLNPHPEPRMTPHSDIGKFDSDFEGHEDDDHGDRFSTSTHSKTQYINRQSGFGSLRSRYDAFMPHQACRSTHGVKNRRCNSLAIITLALAAFSTIFSGVFLVIALVGPHYGRAIRLSGGSLTPNAAATLTTVFARLIEMSFVPVMVAFIGQALSRRAYYNDTPRGVTMAEISMRNWIASPGTMLTSWHSVRYAIFSVLGLAALVAAVLSMLYSVAATALVQPRLEFLDWSSQTFQGLVKSQFANPVFIEQNCQTPLNLNDPVTSDTCINIEHAAKAYHNYYSYMSSWTNVARNGTGSVNLLDRPKGLALVNDNFTITAPWIHPTDVQSLGRGRYVNNVTMALPHIGVIAAGADPINKVLQPNEADSATYLLQASVPSPMVNVLCVTLGQKDLEPFVFDWKKMRLSSWDEKKWRARLRITDPYLGGTPFDDVFKWGPQYGAFAVPPIFPTYPNEYNTVVNDTLGMAYGRTSIYILGQGAAPPKGVTGEPNYSLCQLRAGLTPLCSTQYNATSTGGTLSAHCEDDNDKMQYLRSNPLAPVGNETLNTDWPNVASGWARSLSLNDGVFDGNSSNARQLMSFMVTSPTINPHLPSMAEALAVMSGCTLLESVNFSPFVPFWNESTTSLDPGIYQYFNASIRPQQYASGGFQAYQKPFYVVLVGVFLMNLAVLGYLLWHRDWYTDFSEPMNLFSLAVNSPPSVRLAGCCGAGPSGEHYKLTWKLNNDDGHVYMEDQDPGNPGIATKKTFRESMNTLMTPLTGFKGKVWG